MWFELGKEIRFDYGQSGSRMSGRTWSDRSGSLSACIRCQCGHKLIRTHQNEKNFRFLKGFLRMIRTRRGIICSTKSYGYSHTHGGRNSWLWYNLRILSCVARGIKIMEIQVVIRSSGVIQK